MSELCITICVKPSELDFARSMMAIQKEISDGNLNKANLKLALFFENNAELIQTLEPEALTSILEQCFAANMETKGYDLARQISRQKPSKAMLDRIKHAIAEAKRKAQNA